MSSAALRLPTFEELYAEIQALPEGSTGEILGPGELRVMARPGAPHRHLGKRISRALDGVDRALGGVGWWIEIEAEILHTFRRHRAVPAYEPIVAGGANACVLHYRANQCELKDGDLLLVDAGAEYACYASDITRTIPVNGRYSPEQRAIYQLVLDAQLAAIDQARPGRHWNDVHDAAVKTLTAGLIRLGLLKGSLARNLKDERYKDFYMHKTGHWIGLDVHDVGDYRIDGQPRLIEPGMVMTVEPGLYISPDLKDVPARWRGIGVRIEDDVLVTRNGPEVLTADVVKEIDAIEAAMAAAAAARPAAPARRRAARKAA